MGNTTCDTVNNINNLPGSRATQNQTTNYNAYRQADPRFGANDVDEKAFDQADSPLMPRNGTTQTTARSARINRDGAMYDARNGTMPRNCRGAQRSRRSAGGNGASSARINRDRTMYDEEGQSVARQARQASPFTPFREARPARNSRREVPERRRANGRGRSRSSSVASGGRRSRSSGVSSSSAASAASGGGRSRPSRRQSRRTRSRTVSRQARRTHPDDYQ